MGDGTSMPSPIAFISDIHANLPALKAVLADVEKQQVSKIICLGDVVGYGAQPAECVQLLRERGITTLKGNHDAVVADGPAEDRGRGYMRLMWDWTEQALSFEQRSWLAKLPLTLKRPGFQAAHATLRHPGDWGYVLTAAQADLHFAHQQRPVCFIGHTHRPAFWVAGENESRDVTHPQSIVQDRMQLFNVGSVGQPRDGHPQACYLIYDANAQEVRWQRISYDIASAQYAIEDAGLPLIFAERLASGK